MHKNNNCIIINLQCMISSQYKMMPIKGSKQAQFEVLREVLLKDSSLLVCYAV
jgi:hypothetical protein